MGLGKTVMTIALILENLGRGSSDDQEIVSEDTDETECVTKRITYTDTEVSRKAKGGTLIVCPMALLGQWKVSHKTSNEMSRICFSHVCYRSLLTHRYFVIESRNTATAPITLNPCCLFLNSRMNLKHIQNLAVLQFLFIMVGTEVMILE